MDNKQRKIAVSMAAGLVWSVAVVWIGAAFVNLPVFSLLPTLGFAFLLPGLVYFAMIGVLARRRFFDPAAIDGDAFPTGSKGDIDERVLRNTTEQLVLALALWPAIAYLNLGDGPGVVMALSFGWAIARVLFWIGYRSSPPLRGFGFAATFYTIPVAIVWGLIARIA